MKPLKAILFDLDGTLLDYDMTRELLPATSNGSPRTPRTSWPPRRWSPPSIGARRRFWPTTGTRVNADVFAEAFYP
jgi:FMN phosphatase YigB (HAD superfamily)